MNFLRRFVVLGHHFGLEILLVVSLLSLIGQLSWPALVWWWFLPSPGVVGVDEFTSNSIAEKFVVYLPVSYRQKKSWPLIVYLHGSGKRGNDPDLLRNCTPLQLKLDAVIAAPQCLPTFLWNPEDVAQFTKHVATNYRVDRTRIYLIGHSMGGHGTWFAATAHPELFAAIAPISGGGDPGRASALVDMPIWAFHGAKDQVVPSKYSEQMVDAIRKAKGQPKLTLFPDAGHGILELVCNRKDFWAWLFAQKRPNQVNASGPRGALTQ